MFYYNNKIVCSQCMQSVVTGSAQTQCSREVDCTSPFPRDNVMSCCSIPDALTNLPTPGSEICEPCYSELELWSHVYIHVFSTIIAIFHCVLCYSIWVGAECFC